MAEKVDQEIEQIALAAEYEARQMIPTAGRVITSHDVAVIAARLGRRQGLREAAEVASAWLASDYDESANAMAQSIQDDITALIEGEGC